MAQNNDGDGGKTTWDGGGGKWKWWRRWWWVWFSERDWTQIKRPCRLSRHTSWWTLLSIQESDMFMICLEHHPHGAIDCRMKHQLHWLILYFCCKHSARFIPWAFVQINQKSAFFTITEICDSICGISDHSGFHGLLTVLTYERMNENLGGVIYIRLADHDRTNRASLLQLCPDLLFSNVFLFKVMKTN